MLLAVLFVFLQSDQRLPWTMCGMLSGANEHNSLRQLIFIFCRRRSIMAISCNNKEADCFLLLAATTWYFLRGGGEGAAYQKRFNIERCCWGHMDLWWAVVDTASISIYAQTDDHSRDPVTLTAQMSPSTGSYWKNNKHIEHHTSANTDLQVERRTRLLWLWHSCWTMAKGGMCSFYYVKLLPECLWNMNLYRWS